MADEKISAIQTMLVTLPRARVIGRTRIYILHGKEARRCPFLVAAMSELLIKPALLSEAQLRYNGSLIIHVFDQQLRRLCFRCTLYMLPNTLRRSQER